MHDADLIFINEEFSVDAVSAAQLDAFLAEGWRHFGTHFFRYNLGFYRDDLRRVIPLRIRLAEFSPTKSQRRVLKKNADLHTVVRPIEVTWEATLLFHSHKRRFDQGVPKSVYDFVSFDAASIPCEANEIAVYSGGKLVALSYFDLGEKTTSGIYAMFEPHEHARSLGIFTMLKEIEFAVDSGKEFYYQGYCYEGESFYDYKKRFRGTECFDWMGKWLTFEGR